MPAARTLSVTSEQSECLLDAYRCTHDANIRSRIQMNLLVSQGKSVAETATLTYFDENTVLYWLNRFREHDLGGLLDRPRSGRPKKSHPLHL
jgi:transposase